MATHTYPMVDNHDDVEDHEWFIHNVASDLRIGLERFVPDSPNSDLNGPLYKGTQSLFEYDYDNNRHGPDLWDSPYAYCGDVYELQGRTIFYSEYGCEWFVHMDSGENVCLECASKEHGIYLQSSDYRNAVGLYADNGDNQTCAVFCGWCNEEIKEHDDTDLAPCREGCERIVAEVTRYGGPTFPNLCIGQFKVYIEVPDFDKRITSVSTYNGDQHTFRVECGHDRMDVWGVILRSRIGAFRDAIRLAKQWYGHWYADTRMRSVYMPAWKIACPLCFEAFYETFTPEELECVECGDTLDWERAYICREAHVEPKHAQETRYANDNDGTSRFGRHYKVCVA